MLVKKREPLEIDSNDMNEPRSCFWRDEGSLKTLGIQSPSESGFMGPKYDLRFVSVMKHTPNYPLTFGEPASLGNIYQALRFEKYTPPKTNSNPSLPIIPCEDRCQRTPKHLLRFGL